MEYIKKDKPYDHQDRRYPEIARIKMTPLSQAKAEEKKETLLVNEHMGPPVSVFQGNKFDDNQSLKNILSGRPITDKVDKVYIKTMHGQLQKQLFKDWPVQNVILNNIKNQNKLFVYQPAFKELVFKSQNTF